MVPYAPANQRFWQLRINGYAKPLLSLLVVTMSTKCWHDGQALTASRPIITERHGAAAASHFSPLQRFHSNTKVYRGKRWMVAGESPFSSNDKKAPVAAGLMSHHAAVKTRNITVAIQFYSLLGFEVQSKFRAGPAKAAWLSHDSSNSRIELIEVPSYMLNEPAGKKRRSFDLMKRQDLLGWNHLALDATGAIQERKKLIVDDESYGLKDWMRDLNATSMESFGKSLRIALEPRQQIIGGSVYELAFIYDADGSLIEFLNYQSDLKQSMESGWEPWSGEGFISSEVSQRPISK